VGLIEGPVLVALLRVGWLSYARPKGWRLHGGMGRGPPIVVISILQVGAPRRLQWLAPTLRWGDARGRDKKTLAFGGKFVASEKVSHCFPSGRL